MITTNGRELVTSAMRLVGILATEETPKASELTDAMAVLNGLIDSWGTMPLTMVNDARYVLDVIPNQQGYTVGEFGELPIVPPVGFDHISLIQSTNSPSNEIPMSGLTYEAYQSVLIKELTSPLPTWWHYDRTTADIATLWLWPIPTDSGLQLAIYVQVPTEQFDDPYTEVSLPYGYYKALRYNVAIELAPEYGLQPREDISQIARDSLSRIKAANLVMTDLSVDLGLHPSGRGSYNILNDQGG